MSSDEATRAARRSSLQHGTAHARLLLGARPKPKPVSFTAGLKVSAALALMATFTVSGMALGDTPGVLASRADIDIRVGRNQSSGRVEIYGAIGSKASVRREGDQVVIRLPGQAKPDLGDFRANPPVGVVSVDLKSDSRASELWLKIKDGYDSHFGRSDGAVFVQLDPKQVDDSNNTNAKNGKPLAVNLQDLLKPDATAAAQPGAAKATAAVNVPVVAVQVSDIDGGRDIAFPFAGPVAAAVFRRGDAVWVVFDNEADLRLPPELKDGTIVQDAQWTHNDGFTALRLTAPTSGSLTVLNDGLTWRVRLGGPAPDAKAAAVSLIRDDSSGVPALNLNMAGASKIAWIRDPVVGDRMAVIPARAPVKNLVSARTTLEATFASTAQGAAIVHMTPDVKVVVDGDLVEVTRPGGLTLSAVDPNAAPDESRLEYKSALYPSLMNPDWSNTPQEGFLARYNALQAAAADEGQGGAGAPTKARLALARFLIGQGMTFEAQGALDLLTRQSPGSLGDPQVRGLRVAAKMMSGRYADAQSDLQSGALANDPASKLWAAYGESKLGHYADAVKDFAAGLKALDQFPADWRCRFGAAYANAALQLNDLKTANAMIGYAVTQDAKPLEKLAAYLIDAQIIEAGGDKARALKVYQAVARASDDSIASPALMHVAMLQYGTGKATADQTLNSLSALRLRWRGDNTELNIISSMGQIYLNQGRYREALAVLKSGGQSLMNSPQAAQIQAQLSTTFRSLFLGGMADGLQPVEALGLFYDFKDLAPLGADGDEMLRRIVRRLVDVDLLDQAATLLQYQIDNRLDGVGKSSVAADLAAIDLMNHDPSKALQALWSTRTTLLPKPVMQERSVLEARALNELNEPDKALDVLGNMATPDADDVRADVYWQQQDWAKAAAVLEKRLGDRWKTDAPLNLADESRLIRAGIAYSLMKDQTSLTRMSDRWSKFASTASSPDAMRVALAPLDGGPVNARDFAAAAAQTDAFSGWVTTMKAKFRQRDDAAAKQVGAASASLPSSLNPQPSAPATTPKTAKKA